jgi:hypothetical protein
MLCQYFSRVKILRLSTAEIKGHFIIMFVPCVNYEMMSLFIFIHNHLFYTEINKVQNNTDFHRKGLSFETVEKVCNFKRDIYHVFIV